MGGSAGMTDGEGESWKKIWILSASSREPLKSQQPKDQGNSKCQASMFYREAAYFVWDLKLEPSLEFEDWSLRGLPQP
jgi:hypothetical protein